MFDRYYWRIISDVWHNRFTLNVPRRVRIGWKLWSILYLMLLPVWMVACVPYLIFWAISISADFLATILQTIPHAIEHITAYKVIDMFLGKRRKSETHDRA